MKTRGWFRWSGKKPGWPWQWDNLWACSICGALVHEDTLTRHEDWHEARGEEITG